MLQLHGVEARDKPSLINAQTGKVSGHAVQVWVFLRFIPLLIGHKIQDTSDDVWQLVLLLRQMVELICAPVASDETVAVMKDCIEEYIENRLHCFPEHKLKPKHHFVTHYPNLTLQCGPLIRLWTLRFESKHSFLKKCARSSLNFKNITKTLAEKHQLLQAFYSSGTLFGDAVEVKDGAPFYPNLYKGSILDAVQQFEDLRSSNYTQVAKSVVLNSIQYECGMYVLIGHKDEKLMAGDIKMILVTENMKIFLITHVKTMKYLPDMGIHELEDDTLTQEAVTCVTVDSLLDLLPLNAYKFGLRNFLVLHHAVQIPSP